MATALQQASSPSATTGGQLDVTVGGTTAGTSADQSTQPSPKNSRKGSTNSGIVTATTSSEVGTHHADAVAGHSGKGPTNSGGGVTAPSTILEPVTDDAPSVQVTSAPPLSVHSPDDSFEESATAAAAISLSPSVSVHQSKSSEQFDSKVVSSSMQTVCRRAHVYVPTTRVR